MVLTALYWLEQPVGLLDVKTISQEDNTADYSATGKHDIQIISKLIMILKEKQKKSKRKKSPKQENVNPIYMWMVQPKEETGLKESEFWFRYIQSLTNCKSGRFTLTRSSQKTFSLDRDNLRRSSSLFTESSSVGNISRTSSMSTSTSFLSRTDSVCTRTSSLSEGDDPAPTNGGGRNGSGDGRGVAGGGRGSFLYNFFKQGQGKNQGQGGGMGN